MIERQKKDTNKLYACPSFIEIKNMMLVMNTNFYIYTICANRPEN
jgi:hypothetical protein